MPGLKERFGRAFRFLLLTLFSLGIVLLGLEGAVRLLRPQRNFSVSVNAWDPDIGAVQSPNARGFIHCDEFDIDLIINSKGLRDREFPYEKPDWTRRILSLGDSFAAGYGVQAEETYAKVLEKRLRERFTGGTAWEVLNAAVGSTGTAQQLAYYVREGWKYSPDIVLVGFFISNDFYDNKVSGPYSLKGGQLVKQRVLSTGPRRLQRITHWIPGYAFLSSRSHLLNLIKMEASRRHWRNRAAGMTRADKQGEQDDLYEMTWSLLRALRDACSERGSQLVVMIIPAPIGSPAKQNAWEAELASFLEGEGIPCLNLGPAYRAASRQDVLNFPHDRHWNAQGHAFAADELLAFLDSQGFVE
jgi:hypothetical protein